MGRLDRIRDARRAVQRAALERWSRRTPERERNKAQVAAGGPGAADSPMRQAALSARDTMIGRARNLHRLGMLPFGCH